MLSHACASCGKVLDESSRTHSRELGMWVAACPRCGFAVRWTPRAAREPARVWARLRALNLRLGIAIASIQFAAVFLLISGAIVDGLVRRGLVVVADFNGKLDMLAPALITAAIAGALVGLATATIAPFRKPLTAFAGAWAGTAALLAVLSAVAITTETVPKQLPQYLESFLGRHLKHSEFAGCAVGAALLASMVAAPILRIAVRAGVSKAVRRAARAKREKSAIVRASQPRPIGVSS